MWAMAVKAGLWLANSKAGRAVAIAGGLVLLALMWAGSIARGARRNMELEGHRETDHRSREAMEAADEAREDFADLSDSQLDDELRKRGL